MHKAKDILESPNLFICGNSNLQIWLTFLRRNSITVLTLGHFPSSQRNSIERLNRSFVQINRGNVKRAHDGCK